MATQSTGRPIPHRRFGLWPPLLSLFIPGLGQLMNGSLKKSLLFPVAVFVPFLLLYTSVTTYFVGFVLTISCSIIMWGYSVIDAFRNGRDHPKGRMAGWNTLAVQLLYVAGMIAFLTMVARPALRGARVQTMGPLRTESMNPTLQSGDMVLWDSWAYSALSPMPGELVCFTHDTVDKALYISRCLAAGGHVVEIRDRIPFIDGVRQAVYGHPVHDLPPPRPLGDQDDRVFQPGAGNFDNYGPVTVPGGTCFLLCDNIGNSLDSRRYGCFDGKNFKGRPLFVFWSSNLERIGLTLE